jgi:hypothetical protein
MKEKRGCSIGLFSTYPNAHIHVSFFLITHHPKSSKAFQNKLIVLSHE